MGAPSAVLATTARPAMAEEPLESLSEQRLPPRCQYPAQETSTGPLVATSARGAARYCRSPPALSARTPGCVPVRPYRRLLPATKKPPEAPAPGLAGDPSGAAASAAAASAAAWAPERTPAERQQPHAAPQSGQGPVLLCQLEGLAPAAAGSAAAAAAAGQPAVHNPQAEGWLARAAWAPAAAPLQAPQLPAAAQRVPGQAAAAALAQGQQRLAAQTPVWAQGRCGGGCRPAAAAGRCGPRSSAPAAGWRGRRGTPPTPPGTPAGSRQQP